MKGRQMTSSQTLRIKTRGLLKADVERQLKSSIPPLSQGLIFRYCLVMA
jgi:hypothetical protein